MKRDWELIRKILLALEELGSTQSYLKPEDIEGYDAELVSYHIKLLMEAGLLEGTCTKSISAPLHCVAYRLTWDGHELLDQIRSRSVWNRVVEMARERGLDLSFEVVKAAAKMAITQILS